MRAADVERGSHAPGRAGRGIGEGRAHQQGGVLGARIGPVPVRRVGEGALADLHGLPVDQPGVVRGHVVEVAAEARGDHRLAHVHRLGQGQPEALRAVQRHVAVTAGGERVALGGVEPAVDRHDVGVAARGGLHGGERVGPRGAADRLEHELRPAAGREGEPERLDHRGRVLAPQRAVVVVDEQEQEAVRQAEAGAVGRAGGRHRHGQRHARGRARRQAGHRAAHELAAAPHLVYERGGPDPLDRRAAERLPPPHPDRVAALEQLRAAAPSQHPEAVGVGAHDRDREGQRAGISCDVGVLRSERAWPSRCPRAAPGSPRRRAPTPPAGPPRRGRARRAGDRPRSRRTIPGAGAGAVSLVGAAGMWAGRGGSRSSGIGTSWRPNRCAHSTKRGPSRPSSRDRRAGGPRGPATPSGGRS